jgi:RNA polymerase sigma factor (sigma-70 family)
MEPVSSPPPDPCAARDGGAGWPSPADLDRIRAALLRAVARACPAALASHRDDIVQAALLRVTAVLRSGEHEGIRHASYLWRAAYTATVDELRRATRRREVSLEEAEAVADLATRAPDPEAETAGREVAAAIRACLVRLIRPRRLAVTLHLYGFAAAEASRVLRWDVKRVHNLTYRGLDDLRRCLEAKGVRP